jgi:hypothetical protein
LTGRVEDWKAADVREFISDTYAAFGVMRWDLAQASGVVSGISRLVIRGRRVKTSWRQA